MSDVQFFERPLAFTDFETTGQDPFVHEIIEIGLVLVNQQSGQILEEWNQRIRPLHPETMQPGAQQRNGYDEAVWQDAISLEEGIRLYLAKTAGAIFWAFNAPFDMGFLRAALQQTGLVHTMDYHYFDVMPMAYPMMKKLGREKFSLSHVAETLGLPKEPMPHRAVTGAKMAVKVWQRLMAVEN